jgi:hypothetical protein
LPLEELKKHTYLTGRSGSWKSELIKLIFYRLQSVSQQDRRHSLILLEPHGDLSEECKSLNLNTWKGKGRLIYLDPFFHPAYTFRLNPFETDDKSETTIDVLSQELARTFQELIPLSPLSLQMETLLKPCIAVLLRRGNGSFAELQRFVDDKRNKDLKALGLLSPVPSHRHFFESFFRREEYIPTKVSIFTKIQSLLNSSVFARLTAWPSTLKLEDRLNAGKVLIVNLSKWKMGSEASDAFGRFLLAYLKSLTFKRAHQDSADRKPVFLMIDEFQNYVTQSVGTILTEARKYGLHLLLAQQLPGQNMTKELKDLIFSNTGIKIAGQNAASAFRDLSKEFSLSVETLQQLQPHCFYVKSGTEPAKEVRVPPFLVDPHPYHLNSKQVNDLDEYLFHESGVYQELGNEMPADEKKNTWDWINSPQPKFSV